MPRLVMKKNWHHDSRKCHVLRVTIRNCHVFFITVVESAPFLSYDSWHIFCSLRTTPSKKNNSKMPKKKKTRFLPYPLSDQPMSRHVTGIHYDVRHPIVQGASNLSHSTRNVTPRDRKSSENACCRLRKAKAQPHEKHRKRSLSSTKGKGCTPDRHGDKRLGTVLLIQ